LLCTARKSSSHDKAMCLTRKCSVDEKCNMRHPYCTRSASTQPHTHNPQHKLLLAGSVCGWSADWTHSC
jgi:hypothetical protein